MGWEFIPFLQLLENQSLPDGECADPNLHPLKSLNSGEFMEGPQMHWEEILSISVEGSLLHTPTHLLMALCLSAEMKHSNLLTDFSPQFFIQIFLTDTLQGRYDQQIRGTKS